VGVAGAALLPTATGTATAEQLRTAAGTAATGGTTFSRTSPFYDLGLNASYMVDFWGKNRATLLAAEESATASRYNREVVTLTAMVTVANTYFQVLAAQDELRVARRNLAAAERILVLIKQQFTGGTASQLDVSQQEALVSTERAVGMRAREKNCFAKILLPSSCAAAWVGPTILRARVRNSSTTPATSGASGPTTVRSTCSACARSAKPATDAGAATHRPSCAMPGLPGEATTSVTSGDCFKRQAIACSRPPPPITSIFNRNCLFSLK